MIYYYFMLAFVMLASWAVSGISAAYSPEQIIKKHFTVKNDKILALLKLGASVSKDASEDTQDDPYKNEVSLVGIIMKLIWLVFVILTVVILFALEPSAITKAHKVTLVMPAEVATFNQKIAYYLNLVQLSVFMTAYILNSLRLLSKEQETRKKELAAKIIWALVATAFFGISIFITVKCTPLFAFLQ